MSRFGTRERRNPSYNPDYYVDRFDRFADPDDAPLNVPLQAKVKDTLGDYILPFPCVKTDQGWFNAELGTALGKGIEVVGWRRRDFA